MPAPLLPPTPALGFHQPVDLVLGNWSRGTQVIRHHLPGCMLLTFVCVSITQMPQILSLQDWIEDWAAWNPKRGASPSPLLQLETQGRPVSSLSLTVYGFPEQIWGDLCLSKFSCLLAFSIKDGVINQRNLLQDSSMLLWSWTSSLLFNKVKNSYKWSIGIRAWKSSVVHLWLRPGRHFTALPIKKPRP